MRTIGRAAVVVAMAVAATMASGVAVAGKPSGGGGGGGTGGGKIWYTSGGQTFTMNSDGSGRTATSADPRARVHGGRAWSVRWNAVPGQYPNGNTRREAFAVRDDGVSVQLTDQPDLQCLAITVDPYLGSTPWTPSGLSIAFVGRRYLPGDALEGGLYVADLTFDGAGNITGLVAQPAAPTYARPIVPVPQGSGTQIPDIVRFSWAPDGAQFVYETAQAGIRVGSRTGTDRALVSGIYPQWSPDGSTIAYVDPSGRGSYRTVRPDGAGDKLIYRQSNIAAFTGPLRWSPTGSHISFTLASNGFGWDQVWRISISGGGATNLTSGITSARLAEWTP